MLPGDGRMAEAERFPEAGRIPQPSRRLRDPHARGGLSARRHPVSSDAPEIELTTVRMEENRTVLLHKLLPASKTGPQAEPVMNGESSPWIIPAARTWPDEVLASEITGPPLSQASDLLASTPEGATGYIDADMRDPEAVLARAQPRR